MELDTKQHPEALKDEVQSPGGTSAHAVSENSTYITFLLEAPLPLKKLFWILIKSQFGEKNIIGKMFAENCMKIKKIGLRGGTRP